MSKLRYKNTPAIYAGYRQFFVFCRVTGCCFIDGLLTRHRPSDLKIKIWSWYILYFLAILYFFLWAMVMLVGAESNRPINDTPNFIFYGYSALAYTQAALNMLSMLRHGGAFLEIVRTCGNLEIAIGLQRDAVRKRLDTVSRRCLMFMVLDGSRGFAVTKRVLPLTLQFMRSLHDWVKIGLLVCFEVGLYVVYMWMSLGFWLIVYNASAMKEYFACVNARTVQALTGPTGSTESLQQVRLNHAALRDLVLKINNALDIQITLYYGTSIYYICASAFGVLLTRLGPLERVIRALYLVCLSTGLFVSARAAHNMTTEVKQILSILEIPNIVKKSQIGHMELHLLLVTSEAGKKAFTGCGLFTINLPLLVVMSGAIITYTVVLVQTDENTARRCL
ncbi:unnamed protein product [Ixodes hexagonus]